MEAYNSLQEDIKAKIFKAQINFKKSPKERLTKAYIEIRLENLEKQWSLFTETHTLIVTKVNKIELQNSEYYKKGLYDDVEDLYVTYKCDLKEMLLTKTASAGPSSDVPVTCEKVGTRVKLPEIKIPSFSGKYSEWPTFRDLFIGLIDNNKLLEDAQKFYYLKGHLTGEAEQLLRNISVTADNYKAAWDKLNSMYNNKRFLVNGILKRLFAQKNLTCESASDIKCLLSTTSECLQSIKNLGIDISSWDILIIYIISGKLDKETRRAWELKVSSETSDELATLEQFTDFLSSRFRGLEHLETKPEAHTRVKHPKSTHSYQVFNKERQVLICEYCNADHKITSCPKFTKQSSENRRSFVQDKHLCFICLKNNHSAKICKNTLRCQVCKRRHHSLLHPTGVSGSFGEGNSDNIVNMGTSSPSREVMKEDNITAHAEGSNNSLVSCLLTGNGRKSVLLNTALVKAKSKHGVYRVMRALLDQGSQGSFVTESAVQYLGLKKVAANRTIVGVGGSRSEVARSTVTINVKSRKNSNFIIKVNAYVLKSITSLLPVTKVTQVEWVDLTEDDLADPEYYRPNKIDLLLGAEVYGQIIQEGIKRNPNGNLLAQDTALGWILSGVCEIDNGSETCSHITVMHSSVQEDDMLKRFWELENEPQGTRKMLTDEEIKCEKLFAATTKRNKHGRYVVRLPLRDADFFRNYGDSKPIVEKRLKSLETKLGKNSALKEDYTKVIKEYLDLGHMVKVTKGESQDNSSIYLPHHAVIRADKSTTKVRVVFDASCKGPNGMSLNDNLLVGPTLQPELRHTIMRWRKHKICLVADIVKMYRQIFLDREDTKLQRILWRDNPEDEIKTYELLTVTFGTASAPYLAVRCLQQTAYDECENEPEIADIILNQFYMDDLMSGAENERMVLDIHIKLKEILARGGFQLQKWNSNSKELLEIIKDKESITEGKVTITKEKVTKVLGLTWDPNDDVLQYSVELPALDEPVTKRKILSNISRLFDPLGWLAPSIISAKIFIQKLWLSGLTWDEPVPNNLLKEWDTYRNNLDAVNNVKIPRWYHTHTNDVKTELHGFSDASKRAYAAVIYLRTTDSVGKVHVSLITAKTKVAPIKQVSIPRLELCGAWLTSKLIVEVGEVLNIPKIDWYAWTDSEVVLAWLNGHPSRWKTFVANRVSDILSNLDASQWCHVPSELNPADCASRGITPAELESSRIWWNGPSFLGQEILEFKRPKERETHLEEVKVHTTIIDLPFWNRFSSLSRLVRVLSYCRRFLFIRSQSRKYFKKELSVQELEDTKEICIKFCQQEGFSKELKELKEHKQLKDKKGNLKSLNIFIDARGVLRVGGRLELSDLNYQRKHPILIPKESFLTKLLIADAHVKTLHGGPQLMNTYLRSQYWIMGVKLLTKKYVRSCVKCVRYAAKTSAQLMGQVPSVRLQPGKPFLSTGVDYAGPVNIRISKGRGNKSYKGYIALFICMTTRAVHLEVVSDLSTRGFMAAFKRFVARRGRVISLYSDNAKNFVGAARELINLFAQEKSNINSELTECLSSVGTQWHFIPPHTPNFGGLWEAGIKSTKHHLKRVIGNSTLTFEEMSTVLAQIEACLNSRPLSYVEDENKLTILTPGHFLIGEPPVTVPEADYVHQKVTNLQRWQVYQRMTQDFWKCWSNDYLHQFLQRYKWSVQTLEPSVGNVVLIKEDDMPPGKWLLGKIEQKHLGPDGICRVVTLRTQTSTIKRPTSKLCMLPMAN